MHICFFRSSDYFFVRSYLDLKEINNTIFIDFYFFQISHNKSQFPSQKAQNIALKADRMLALVPFTFILLRVWKTLRWIFVLYIDTGKSQAWWNTALFYLQVGFMCQSRQKPAFDSFFLKWYKSYHILYKNHLYKQYDLTRKSGQVWWLSLTTIRSLIFFLQLP